MKRRALLKLLGLFSAVRGYNIAMVCVAQYLASIFVLSKQSWREVLSDTHLLMLVIAGAFIPAPVDKTALRAAIAAAQNEPLYIRRDETVAKALVKAQKINSSQSATKQERRIISTSWLN